MHTVLRELDFREEAINLERVRRATLAEPSLADRVVIPKTLPECVCCEQSA